jgi:Protein of unknown function (DUF1656)
MPELLVLSTGLIGTRKNSSDEGKAGKVNLYPHEIAIGGVYMPPLLIAALLGTIAAVLTARQLNRYRLSRYFFYPPLFFVAMTVIYTVLIGTFVIRI